MPVVSGSVAARQSAMKEWVVRAKSESNPEKAAMFWLKAGNIAASLDTDRDAETYFRRAVPLSKVIAGDAYLMLAQLRQRQGRPDEAIRFAYDAISPNVQNADPGLREAALTVAFDNVPRLEVGKRVPAAQRLYAQLRPTESAFFRFSYQEWNRIDPALAELAIKELERRPELSDDVAYCRLEQLRLRYPTGTEPLAAIEAICRKSNCKTGRGLGVGYELAMAAYREDDLETAKQWTRVVLDAPRQPGNDLLREAALRLATELKIDGPYRDDRQLPLIQVGIGVLSLVLIVLAGIGARRFRGFGTRRGA
ncbi:MAG: hypothetical protein SFX74_10395 [Fimbriimonadaceae bacterium]|nr:hypothetical protein [Fimbriimonadaceae bacterium]